VTRRLRTTPASGSSAALARTIADIWRLLRTFPADQLDGSGDQSECPEPNEQAPKPAPQIWLEQHLEHMADQFADALAARLSWDTPAKSDEPLLLTRAQVAATLQITVRTLDRWTRRGLVPEPMHIGGTSRWLREDLEDWFQRRGGPQ
jgi:predicted DNA-binding transcriptional regulator AlpA